MHTVALLFVVSIGATVGASVGGSGEVASGPNVNEAGGEWASGDAMSGEIRLNRAGLALEEGLPSAVADDGAQTHVSTTQTSATDEDSWATWGIPFIITVVMILLVVGCFCTLPAAVPFRNAIGRMCCPGTTTASNGVPAGETKTSDTASRYSTGISLASLQPTTLPTLINLQAKPYKHVSATPPGSSCDDDEVW